MMTVRKGLCVSAGIAGLVLSQAAGAFGMMEVGEWKIEFSGNVNAFASDVKCESDPDGPVLAGLACGSLSGGDYNDNNIRTGLLPSWFGFHAERTEEGKKYGISIGFQPGIDGGNQGSGLFGGNPIDGALGLNSEPLDVPVRGKSAAVAPLHLERLVLTEEAPDSTGVRLLELDGEVDLTRVGPSGGVLLPRGAVRRAGALHVGNLNVVRLDFDTADLRHPREHGERPGAERAVAARCRVPDLCIATLRNHVLSLPEN